MVRLVVYNIEYCHGTNGRWYEYLKLWRVLFPPRDLDQKIIEELKKLEIDILGLIEVDTGSIRAGKNVAEHFANQLDMLGSAGEKYRWNKFYRFVPILNRQANALLSKFKIEGIQYHLLNNGAKRLVIEASLSIPQKVTILLAHLALGYKTRKKQLKDLVKIVNNAKYPVILMGDLNTFRGEEELQYLMANTNLYDSCKGQRNTHPSVRPRKRLDYILTSKNLRVTKYDVLDLKYSDHLPVMVEIEVKN